MVAVLSSVLVIRLALQGLGVEAFGTYIAVASLPLALSFMTAATTLAAQRAIAMELQSGRAEKAFNTAFFLHLAVALSIFLIGELVGFWFLSNVLSIPRYLLDSAYTVLHISVFASAAGAVMGPYEALLQAKERFGTFLLLDVVRSVLLVSGAAAIVSFSGDRLVGLAIVYSVGTILTSMIAVLVARVSYSDSDIRLNLLLDLRAASGQLHLISWSAIGSLAAVGRTQGFAILMNIFYGPTGSAAYGVANQLTGGLRQLSAAITSAVAPSLFKLEASGQREKVIEAACVAAKFSFFGTALAAIPLLIEIEAILRLWLTIVPPYASVSAAFLIAALMLDQTSSALGLAHLAVGRLARYQLICGLGLLSALPIAYGVGRFGASPSGLLSVFVVASAFVAAARTFLLSPISEGVVRRWLLKSVAPVLFAAAGGAAAAFIIHYVVQPSFGRLLAVFAVFLAATVAIGYFTALNSAEKRVLSTIWFARRGGG